MDITISRAQPEEAEEILEYLRIVGGETDNLTFGSEGFPMTVKEEQRYLESLMSTHSSIMLLARKDGRIVGNASFNGYLMERTKHRGDFGISVLKAEWGNGIGSRLLEKIIEFAKDEAYAEIISLEVRSDNIRAIKLYKKYGFETIGHFKGFFKIDGKDIDFDLMNLYLENSFDKHDK